MKNKLKSILTKTGSIFLAIILFISSALSTYFLLSKTTKKQETKEPQAIEETIPEEEQSFISPDGTYNVLLLGYGGAGHDGGTLSDTIMVANVNPEQKKVVLISVPRDLWVAIPIRSDKSEYFKINMAHAIGLDDTRYPLKEPVYKGKGAAGRLAMQVVSKVVGMPINYYVSISFEGFKEAIDILDGIEVEVPKTFDDYFYPVKGLENETCGYSPEEIHEFHQKYSGFELEKQFECRYEHLHFDKGKNQINGDMALKFVRSRHSAQHGGDFARSQRQKAVLIGIKDRVLSLGFLDDAIPFFEKFEDTIDTNISTKVIKNMIEIIGQPNEYEIGFLSLNEDNVLNHSTSANGQYILIPKEGIGEWEEIHNYIKEE